MHFYFPSQDQYYSDLEVSEPGTVRVTMNRSNYMSENTHSEYQEDPNESANYYGSDLEMEDNQFDLGTQEQEYLEQSRIVNANDVKCILDEVNCMICFHLVSDPVNCALCEALFCRLCIRQWFDKSSTNQVCPCCRASCHDYLMNNQSFNCQLEYHKGKPSIISSKVPLLLKKILSKIKLSCIYQEEGCEEELYYDHRIRHETQLCQFAKTRCPNNGCQEMIQRKHLQDHLDSCQYAEVVCRFCDNKILRLDHSQHLSSCDHRLIPCQWCKEQQYQYEALEHEMNCNLKIVDCPLCKQEFFQERFIDHTTEVCWRQMYEKLRESEQKLRGKLLKAELENKALKEENKKLVEENIWLRQRTEMKRDQPSSTIDRTQEEEKKQDDDYQFDFEDYDEEGSHQIVVGSDNTFNENCEDIENVESIEEVIEEEEEPPLPQPKITDIRGLSRLLGLDINDDLLKLLEGLE